MAMTERMKASLQLPLTIFVPAHTHSWRRTTTAARTRTTIALRRLEESLDAPTSKTPCRRSRLRRGGCVQLTVQAS